MSPYRRLKPFSRHIGHQLSTGIDKNGWWSSACDALRPGRALDERSRRRGGAEASWR